MIIDDRRSPPPTDEPTENSPLLAGQNGSADSKPGSSSSRFMRFQRAHLALPVVFLGFMSGAITVTTSLQIVRIIACQFWYGRHDPSQIPPSGPIPEPLCDAPGPQKLFAQITQAAVIIDLCGGLITSSPIGTLSAKFGRKPLIIAVSILAIIAPLILLVALYSSSMGLIFLSTVIGSIGGIRQLILLSTMFIVDVSHDPAPVLSVLEGSIFFGEAISFSLGGLITKWSGNVTYVFWIQVAICLVLFFYIVLALPESFGYEQRAARAAEVAAERSRGRSRDSRPNLTRSRSASLERVRDTAGAFSRPIALIWPQRDPITGKRNKRLFILSVAILLAFTGSSYAGPGFLVYSTNRFHATPEQNGYLLSSFAGGRALYLFIMLPPILKWGRAWYKRRHPTEAHVAGTESDSTNSQFEVHLLAFSWLVNSIALVGVGLSPSFTAASACLLFITIASGANPCISTIVSASVDPLARGEALAAIALVRSVAEFLSPIVLGSILTSTTNTRLPQTAFFVASILLFLAVGIAVLIRDQDRYVRARDDDPQNGECLVADE